MKLPRTLLELQSQNETIIQELLDIFIPRLKKLLEDKDGLDFVILHGSRARGDYGYASDVDMIVCSHEFENLRIIDRPDIIFSCIEKMHVEPICFTPEEAKLALKNGNVSMLDALEEGIILFSRGPVLDELKEEFEHLKSAMIIQRAESSSKVFHWRIAV